MQAVKRAPAWEKLRNIRLKHQNQLKRNPSKLLLSLSDIRSVLTFCWFNLLNIKSVSLVNICHNGPQCLKWAREPN